MNRYGIGKKFFKDLNDIVMRSIGVGDISYAIVRIGSYIADAFGITIDKSGNPVISSNSVFSFPNLNQVDKNPSLDYKDAELVTSNFFKAINRHLSHYLKIENYDSDDVDRIERFGSSAEDFYNLLNFSLIDMQMHYAENAFGELFENGFDSSYDAVLSGVPAEDVYA